MMTEEIADIVAANLDIKLLATGFVSMAEITAAIGCAIENSPELLAAWDRKCPDFALVRAMRDGKEGYATKWRHIGKLGNAEDAE